MKLIGIFFLAFIAISTTTYSSSSKNLELKDYLSSKKEEILTKATSLYDYTFQPFSIDPKNCVGKDSEIGTVGVCLVTLETIEENVIVTFAVSATSHYAGTGEITPIIKLTLIDYLL